MENWRRFLDEFEIILNAGKIKPKEVSENILPFLDNMIHIDGRKIWMDNNSKPTDLKRYVPFNSSQPKNCLINISFCIEFAQRICRIVENSNNKKLREE